MVKFDGKVSPSEAHRQGRSKVVEFILFDTPADEICLEKLGVTENLVMKFLADCVCGSTEEAALKRLLAAAHITDKENRDKVRSIIGKLSQPKPRKMAIAA
jgi:hypothetical protein